MNRTIRFAPGEFYHAYNRGNDKREIFLDKADRDHFIWLLFFCNSSVRVDSQKIKRLFCEGDTFTDFVLWRGETLTNIGAFCLMPNHFHLLLHEKKDGGISKFLKKLCTAYSMYFNLKYSRKGKLFEGVFKATHASNDEHLKYLFAYIHLNPLKLIEPLWRELGLKDIAGGQKYVEGYEFSSFNCYLEENSKNMPVLNEEAFPEYFSEKGMREFIEEWLRFDIADL